MDEHIAHALIAWRQESTYTAPTDWMWASTKMAGKQPLWLSTIMRYYIQPAARHADISKKIGWHTFRHTFLDVDQVRGRRREGCARTIATCVFRDDDERLHAGARTTKTQSTRTTCRPDHAHGNGWSRINVVERCGRIRSDARKSLILWRPRRDLNPRYRRERTTTIRKYNDLQEAGGTLSPC